MTANAATETTVETTNSVECLTSYLLREGFYAAVPENRKRAVLNLDDLLLAVCFILTGLGYPLLMTAIAQPINEVLILILFAVFILEFVVLVVTDTKLPVNLLASLMFLGYPILRSILVSIFLASLALGIGNFVLSFATWIAWMWQLGKNVQVPLIGPAIGSTLYVAGRSASSAISLLPLLLIAVLLSVFSQELWQVGSSLPPRNIATAGIVIWLAVLLIALTSWGKDARDIVDGETGKDQDKTHIFTDAWGKLGCLQEQEIQQLKECKPSISDNIKKDARGRVTRWLAVTYVTASLFITGVCATFFLAIFSYLITERTLTRWVSESQTASIDDITVYLGVFGLEIYSPFSLVGAVSLFLGFLLGAQALTDEATKARSHAWIQERAKCWMAASVALAFLSTSVTSKQENNADKQ